MHEIANVLAILSSVVGVVGSGIAFYQGDWKTGMLLAIAASILARVTAG